MKNYSHLLRKAGSRLIQPYFIENSVGQDFIWSCKTESPLIQGGAKTVQSISTSLSSVNSLLVLLI